MRLRQVALAARDLAASVEDLTDVLGIDVSFNDPGVAFFGLENAVMPIGDTFLEVVSPVRADATAQRWIEKRGGDSGYMVILQTEDRASLDSEVVRAKKEGAIVVWEGEHEGAKGVHFHPRELGAILSFDAMPSWNEWVWAGPRWREHVRTQTTTAITGVEIESPDPQRLAERWAAWIGAPAKPGPGARPEIALPRGGRLRFVPSEGAEGLIGVEVALADPARFEARARDRGAIGADGAVAIAGVRFVPAHPR